MLAGSKREMVDSHRISCLERESPGRLGQAGDTVRRKVGEGDRSQSGGKRVGSEVAGMGLANAQSS